MATRRSGAVLGLLLAAVGGCATHRAVPQLPPTLGEDGLVVARFYVLGMEAIENASVEIDNVTRSGALREGYLALSLPPGEHTLKRLRAQGQLLGASLIEAERPIRPARGGAAPIFIYVPGQTIHFTTLEVSRTFQVERGRVTNLGLIVYLPDPADAKRAQGRDSRRFQVVALDNGAEVDSFLETNYPELVSSLKDRQLILAPGKYLEPAKLPELRRAIAYHESRGPHVLTSPTQALVFGRAGTIVSLTKDPAAASPKVEVLDTGTLADVVVGARQGQRYAFATADSSMLYWDRVQLTREVLPHRVQPVSVGKLGEQGLVVVDNRLRVLTVQHPGDPWPVYEGALLRTPRSDVHIASDGAGAVISVGTQGVPAYLYRLAAGASVPGPIAPPPPQSAKPTDLFFVVSRPSGLFVLYGSKGTSYFRSWTTGAWKLRSLPQADCARLGLDEEGREMTVTCGGVPFRSVDSGASWSRPET